MFRRGIALSILSLAAIAPADSPPETPATQPTTYLLAMPTDGELIRLNPGVKVMHKADSFEALVQSTKPNFVWNLQDMLWITLNAKGKVGFAMNRPIELQLQPNESAFCLCDAAPNGDTGIFPYTFNADPNPIIIARDPKFGVVYQTYWNSGLEIDCQRTTTRTIFLLCNGAHHWHLLGEGPICRNGLTTDERDSYEQLQGHVQWTGDPRRPLRLTFTLSYTFPKKAAGRNPHHHESIVVQDDLADTVADKNGYDVPQGYADCTNEHYRSPFQHLGPYYIMANKTESTEAFIARMSRCMDQDMTETERETYRTDLDVIIPELNPTLGDVIHAGQKINFGDDFTPRDPLPYLPAAIEEDSGKGAK